MDPLSRDAPGELEALLVLDRLPGVGPRRIRALVERFGSAIAALGAPRSAFERVAPAPAAAARREPSVRAAVDAALARAAEIGIDVISWGSDGYPDGLRHLADPPPVLFLRGRVELLGSKGVTVVGARRATARSRDVAERLGRAMAEAGVPVVSGLALGVDGAAHSGALSRDGDTIAVMGTGADVPYPRAHLRLYREIAERGLIVSEFLPGTPALPHHFPRRNRILAALGAATVVVEAGARSGSLITVDHALDLGRDVWVVPGPIERAPCAGSNRLLSEGARPLLSIAQLASELSDGEVRRSSSRAGSAGDHLAALLGILTGEPLTGDEVAERLGVSAREVLAWLTELELDGAVERLPGMRFRSAA